MSVARRRQMIEREHASLSVVAQCRLVSLSRLRRGDLDENAPSNRMRIARGCGGAGRSPEPT